MAKFADNFSQEHFEFAQKLAQFGYWEWDFKQDLVTGTDLTFHILGLPPQAQAPLEQLLANVVPEDLGRLSRTISSAINENTKIEISFRVASKNNQLRFVECMGALSFDEQGEALMMRGTIQDITRFHHAQSTVEYQAKYDVLTGIANRQFFESTLLEHCKQLEAEQCASVIVLDIDHFKVINDGHGQKVGDQVLNLLAQRLKIITRKGDFIARLGSDEFAILVRSCKNEQELQYLINRLEKDLKLTFMVNGYEIYLTYSFGISSYPYDTNQPETLLHKANIARGKAKKHGGNQAVFYQSEMNTEAKYRFMLENDLHRSIEQGEIKVFFQPQVDAKTLKPIGAEALVRWHHPVSGWISPEVFVPLAENSGLINDIGIFVLEQSLQKLEDWAELGYKNLRVGVNLSPFQLKQPGLVADIKQQILSKNINPKYLDLEITESLAMADAQQTTNLLRELKKLGVSLAIDDFGTGYSSLSYLHAFPIDTIKIDQSFVANINTKAGETLVKTIVAMAKGLGLGIVAEGIENQSQIEFLQQNNCDILQGFFFGKPMQSHEFEEYLKQHLS